MRQVLFTIPVPWGELPIYGYGFMLFLAFVGCTWLAARLAAREGIARESKVAKITLYRQFGNKEKLFFEVTRYAQADVRRNLEALVDTAGPAGACAACAHCSRQI